MAGKNYCIFACGGHGSRMGADVPKQFLRLDDKTILQHSIEKVIRAVPGVKLILALPEDYMDFWKEECVSGHLDYPQTLVKGGITRFHSVRNALDGIPEDAVVGVHDAARPFASSALIARLYEKASTCPAVVPVIPVTDTLKVLDGDLGEIDGESADRSRLFGAQTPQVFNGGILREAYSQPYDTRFTDDASVVSSAGFRVSYVPGEKYNLKITTPEDFSLAKILVRFSDFL